MSSLTSGDSPNKYWVVYLLYQFQWRGRKIDTIYTDTLVCGLLLMIESLPGEGTVTWCVVLQVHFVMECQHSPAQQDSHDPPPPPSSLPDRLQVPGK